MQPYPVPARRAGGEAGGGGVGLASGMRPGWAYIGEPPEDRPPAWLTGPPEKIAEELRADRAVGANAFHLKFRARTIEEYLDQLAAFGEQVRHFSDRDGDQNRDRNGQTVLLTRAGRPTSLS